jgi:hypothetical protein
MVHDLVAECFEHGTLKRLGEIVGQHLLGRAVGDGHFLVSHSVSHKEVSDVDMSGSFPAGCLSILL